MSWELAIATSSLRKEYGDVVAVEGLDLSIERGTVYGFLGPNGAGKTTTMRMLTTLTRPTSGSGSVAGESIADRESLTSNIGYLPEQPPLYEALTGYEQLEYYADLRGVPEEQASDRIHSLLERLDLADDADKRIDGYSKGMRQKVALVQTLVHDPAVVFLDEPTSGLDPQAARTMRELVTDLADRGTTVFLSTHILPVVDELADMVGVLRDGELVAESPPETLKRRAEDGGTLEDAFLDLTTERSAEASV